MSKNTNKMKNQNLKKHGLFATIFAVAFVAVIVLVNLLSTSVAQKLPTTIDLSTENSNSLTPENIEFIKGISTPVEIIVCATREGYTGSEMVSYASSVYYVQENNTPDNYFNQTITLLENYCKYNENITLSYIDPQSPKFNELESGYTIDVTYGDILVRATRPDESGKQETYEAIITFEDIYELYDASSGMGGSMYGFSSYTITASNIETEVSGAIYTVAASDKSKIAVLTTHSTLDAELALTTALKEYNYDVVALDGIVKEETLKDVDTVLLAAPVSDLSADELKALDKFLDNDGKRGKNFMVFGSNSSPATPNLNEFLEEWGIKVKDGMAYDTNAGYRLSDGNSMLLFNQKNPFTGGINGSEQLYYSGDIVAIERAFEEEGTRTSQLLMTTSPYAVTAPKGVSGYTASSNDVQGEMPVIIVTSDTVYDKNYDEVSSYVGYFASIDFINDAWQQFNDNGNMDFAIAVTNAMSGRSTGMYFLPKITGLYSMNTPFTDAQYTAIYIIFIITIPAILMIGGVIIWLRRKNR